MLQKQKIFTSKTAIFDLSKVRPTKVVYLCKRDISKPMKKGDNTHEINISPCPSHFRTLSDTHPIAITWDEVYRLVREDALVRYNTEQARAALQQDNRRAFDNFKRLSGAITPATSCQGGHARKHIVAYTLVSMVDLDHVAATALDDLYALICADVHTFMAWRTVSGEGIRVLYRWSAKASPSGPSPVKRVVQTEGSKENEAVDVKMRTEQYALAWQQGNDYYAALAGMEVDEHTKDPTRFSFLCHDPDAYYNREAVPFKEPTPREPTPDPSLKGRGKASPTPLLKEGATDSPDTQLNTEAFSYAVTLVEREGTPYAPGHHNDFIMRLGYLLNRLGVPQEEAIREALRRYADYPHTESVIRSCYQQQAEFGTLALTDKGSLVRKDGQAGGQAGRLRRIRQAAETSHRTGKLATDKKNAASRTTRDGNTRGKRSATTAFATVTEIEEFLNEHVQLRYNLIASELEIRDGEEWHCATEKDINTLWSDMCRSGQRYVRLGDLWNIIHSNYVPDFNPFTAYFDSLPAYDATTQPDAIRGLADRITVSGDSDLFRRCFRKWLVGLVPALLTEATNQVILVLIGEQGIYKSTFFSRLLPPELRRYYYSKTNSTRMNKDDKFTLTEFALICFDELDSMTDSELNQLKSLVTIEEIHERPAYGRVKEHRRHIASFCGTGNNKRFLTDLTGNRRWMPFEVTAILSPYDHPIDYTAVYSQALHLWQSGFPYWFTREEIDELNRHNEQFEVPNMEAELILRHYRHPSEGEMGHFKTATDILERCNYAMKKPLSVSKIGQAMKRLGFISSRASNGRRGYIVIERPATEIDLQERTDAFNIRNTLTEDGGRKTEDGRRKTEDGGRRTEDGGLRTEDRRQRTEDGGRRTEDCQP